MKGKGDVKIPLIFWVLHSMEKYMRGDIMKLLLELFITFCKIGFFTFGGGYAMISFMEENCIEKKKWISHEDMMNVTVIAESTPGPIAINCATFIGYKQAGLIGAVISTLGMVFPSFIVIFIISIFFDNFLKIQWIAHALNGIKIYVGILILNAAVTMLKKMPKNKLSRGIVFCAAMMMLLIFLFSLRISSVLLMLFFGVFSLVFMLITENKRGKRGDKK